MTYETFVERTIELFITKIDNCFVNKSGVQGIIDVPTWLTYFTFDVMSDLTYSKHHGFISRGEDAYGIINWVKTFLDYGFIVRDSMFMHSKPFEFTYLQVGQMPWTNLLLRHNPILLWLERRGLYGGNTFPGATFAVQRIEERKRQKPIGDEEDEREDLLDKYRRATRERPEYATDKEVLGFSLSNMIAGAETTLDPWSPLPSENHSYSQITAPFQ